MQCQRLAYHVFKPRLAGTLAITALTVACCWAALAFDSQGRAAPHQSPGVGLIRERLGASSGFVLFGTHSVSASLIFLIDKAGNLVHEWKLAYGARRGAWVFPLPELLPSGQLMVKPDWNAIATVDADGRELWRYEATARIHHDHVSLPNGNLLLLLKSPKPRTEVIAAGANPAFVGPDGLMVDHLLEIRPASQSGGEVVWRWSPWDHLVQDFDPDKPNYGRPVDHPGRIDLNYLLERLSTTDRLNAMTRKGWPHANAIDFHAEAGHVLFLARNFSELWVVDHSTTAEESAGSSGGRRGRGGDLLWRWGNPRAHGAGTVADQQLFWPHAAHWIPAGLPGAGNILLFNNGDEFDGLHRDYSEVLELTYPLGDAKFDAWPAGEPHPPAAPVWRYLADPPGDFLSHRVSSAQRLPNGNTLIASGLQGTLFEVTPQGREVWRYVSPVAEGERLFVDYQVPVSYDEDGFRIAANFLYRAFEYPRDYLGLKALDLTPKGTLAHHNQPAGRSPPEVAQ